MPGVFVGLMSGTSLDGIDAVAATFGGTPQLICSNYQPFAPTLRDDLLALQAPGDNELHRAAIAANQLAHAYAAVVTALLQAASLQPRDVEAIGCHGQTVRHRPDAGYTTQLVNGALLAELTGIRVITDFRSRDIAAGGQGAPLVPAFHHRVFHSGKEHRVIVNIGGIANITNLPSVGAVTGFDCGSGNALMDGWIAGHRAQPYDAQGAWAASGKVVPALFAALFSDPYFSLLPPKSTGRDLFNHAWLEAALHGDEAPQDVQATLLELTAQAIAQAINRHCAGAQAVFVCGGGAHNLALMARLAVLLPECRVSDTQALGIDADWVEALAFAWLAQQAVLGKPGNLPGVTGARGPRILGAIYPV